MDTPPPAPPATIAVNVSDIQEIFRRLDKLDANFNALNQKLDNTTANLTAQINATNQKLDETTANLTARIDAIARTEEPTPSCFLNQGHRQFSLFHIFIRPLTDFYFSNPPIHSKCE